MDEWTEMLEKGQIINIVYFDFQKAFDTVPHRRLIELMKHYQIDDVVIKWVNDFLTNRKQQVIVEGNKSSTFDVKSGVPQGSVLGPLLFLIYINLMVEKVNDNDGMYLFADDLKLYSQTLSNEEINEMQLKIDRIDDWTKYSLLKFNAQKCKVMRLSSNKKDVGKPCYNIGDRKISLCDNIEDLGVKFDNHLSFETHINEKVNKANQLAGMIRRSFVYLDKTMFRSLFTSIVRPHLEYGATLWNPLHKRLIEIIENVQRRASKQVPGLSQLSYKERLKSLKLPTLQYRRYRGDMIELYKLFNNCYNESISMKLRKSLQSNFTRKSTRNHKFSIYKTPFTKMVRKSYFKCRVTEQWNNLPESIVEAPSIKGTPNRARGMP